MRTHLNSRGDGLAHIVLDGAEMPRSWLVGALLASCVPSQSSVFGPVERDVQHRLGLGVAQTEDGRTSAAIDALLAKPVDLDAAVRIALARNRRLQARSDELGIAASRVADATVLPPATADADYERALSGNGSEIEFTVVQDVLDLLQVGRSHSSRRRFALSRPHDRTYTHMMTKLFALLVPVALASASYADAPKATTTPRIAVAVTKQGFDPDSINVPAKQPVTLVFTRKTDQTCTKSVVVTLDDGKTIERELPLDKPVEIAVTFPKAGKLGYACSMNMSKGVIVVQ